MTLPARTSELPVSGPMTWCYYQWDQAGKKPPPGDLADTPWRLAKLCTTVF